MKKCADCGCFNKNARVVCADCGRSLAGAAQVDQAELDAKLEKLSRFSDPFSFKPRYQIVFYASLLLFAAVVVLNILSMIQPEMAFIVILCCIICILFSRFAEAIWETEKFFMQFKIRGGIEPSDWWYISREIVIFGFFIAGILIFLLGLANNGAGNV